MQFNRSQVRHAVTMLFTGDPKEHPDLAAVLQEMGLSAEEKILHDRHPLVVAAAAANPGEPFVLAPMKAVTPSSVLDAEGEVFDQFRYLLGEVFIPLSVCATARQCLLRLTSCFWCAGRSLLSTVAEAVSRPAQFGTSTVSGGASGGWYADVQRFVCLPFFSCVPEKHQHVRLPGRPGGPVICKSP